MLRLRRRAAWVSFAIVVLAVAALYIFREPILWQMGQSLVNDGPPQKSDVIVVLGGDARAHRILKAASLAREGDAPKVLVSGAFGYWGHYEGELAVAYAVEKGYPRAYFEPVLYPAVSTMDESAHDAAEIRKMGAHKVILVTDPWHTARAIRIFRRAAPDLEVHAVSCTDPNWQNGYWWRTREGRKVWAFEALKTAANYLGI